VLKGYAWDYTSVLSEEQYDSISFSKLPGFTRSVSRRNYALVTPESHVWAKNPLWVNSTTAHIISPAVGSNFAMYLARMGPGGKAINPKQGVERLAVVLDGYVTLMAAHGLEDDVLLKSGEYVYLPPNITHRIRSAERASLLVFERRCKVEISDATFFHGSIEERPLVDVPGEDFKLRKLLPDTTDMDFNVHVMDFLPGEHLNVREVHYNQHGLLLVSGKGIYRLGDDYMPVKSGDAIWMAPYCPQWFAALGREPARYILYKDTTIDPLVVDI